MTELNDFLGLGSHSTLKLCLSRFDKATIDSSGRSSFEYPSYAMAERDVRSAIHVQRLASDAGAEIDFISPDELAGEIRRRNSMKGLPATIVFGSRSNTAFLEVLAHSPLGQLVEFEFADEWTIRTNDGSSYSLPDPSRMSRAVYAAKTDYGIVGWTADSGTSHIVVAGLGGRATEGCGLYLQRNWAKLAESASSRPFVALLRFDPPIDPANYSLLKFIVH
jgi:hypothetical protein